MASRIFGIIVLISFCIYLAYRFWQVGYKIGGPVVAGSVCLGLLVFGAVGLWWAVRPDKSKPSSKTEALPVVDDRAPRNGASPH